MSHYLTIENPRKSLQRQNKSRYRSGVKGGRKSRPKTAQLISLLEIWRVGFIPVPKGLVDSMFCDPATVVECTGATEGSLVLKEIQLHM